MKIEWLIFNVNSLTGPRLVKKVILLSYFGRFLAWEPVCDLKILFGAQKTLLSIIYTIKIEWLINNVNSCRVPCFCREWFVWYGFIVFWPIQACFVGGGALFDLETRSWALKTLLREYLMKIECQQPAASSPGRVQQATAGLGKVQ